LIDADDGKTAIPPTVPGAGEDSKIVPVETQAAFDVKGNPPISAAVVETPKYK
jgi:hypothetical protein